MCGRYASTSPTADLSRLFAAFDVTGGQLVPDYNVAPTDRVPVVLPGAALELPEAARIIGAARWGLLPDWAADPRVGARMINARSETVATSRAYASAFAGRRCLVPADGWYEWVRTDHGKQAYYMTGTRPPVFAGIWSSGRFGLTFSVVTTAAVGHLAQVHDRMPLLLEPDRWQQWLTAPAAPGLLAAPSLELVSAIEVRRVGRAVGDVRNDGPQLIAELPQEPVQQILF